MITIDFYLTENSKIKLEDDLGIFEDLQLIELFKKIINEIICLVI